MWLCRIAAGVSGWYRVDIGQRRTDPRTLPAKGWPSSLSGRNKVTTLSAARALAQRARPRRSLLECIVVVLCLVDYGEKMKIITGFDRL